MNIEHFRQKLHQKEKELTSEIARRQNQAVESPAPDVGDAADEATADEDKAEAAQANTIEWATLRLVRDALKRIENGTYGKCVDCGRQIPEARLEAVPWTPYCRDDQEKHDRQQHVPTPADGEL